MFMIPQRIAYPAHTVLGELKTAELFVVSSLRLWVMSHSGPVDAYPDWREGLHRARIGTAGAVGFDTLCRILATTALRSLDVRSLTCKRLGEDEAWMLSLLGQLQHDRVGDAERILSSWCPPSAARLAITPARAFATALCARRLRLPAYLLEHATTSPAFGVEVDRPRIH